MPARGFDAFAQLRMRDRKPGPADYGYTAAAAPEASQRTILRKRPEQTGWVNPVGPGTYDIGTTVGSGRAVQLPPHADDEPANSERTTAVSKPVKAASSPPPPADACSAWTTYVSDTPAFSIQNRTLHPQDELRGSPFPNAGPGSYDIPNAFDEGSKARSAGQLKGKSFGLRTEALGAYLSSCAPGPGTYSIPRFADSVSESDRADGASTWRGCKKGPLGGTSPRWAQGTASHGARPGRGPGDFDDPNSIESRYGKRISELLNCDSNGTERASASPSEQVALLTRNRTTFGGRHAKDGNNPFDSATHSPGPAAYSTEAETAVLAKHASRPAPRFVRQRFPPMEELQRRRRGSKQMRRHANTAAERCRALHMPSDFDYDYRKGFTMLGRWPDKTPTKMPKHRFDLEEEERAATARPQGRQPSFAPHPYDPLAVVFAQEAASRSKETAPGPGSYAVRYSAVQPRSAGVLVAVAERQPHDEGVPGPGHYAPRYNVVAPDAGGTTFSKGSFAPRGGGAFGGARTDGKEEEQPPLPQSDADGGKSGRGVEKGFTFGVQYPARAVHQLAPPKDEFNNTNCTYKDERLWETAVKARPAASSAPSYSVEARQSRAQ